MQNFVIEQQAQLVLQNFVFEQQAHLLMQNFVKCLKMEHQKFVLGFK
jgi:hypothetical protein